MEGSARRGGEVVLVFEILEDAGGRFYWRAKSPEGMTLLHALDTFASLEACITDASDVATARPAV
jgi:hypothetical protein